LNTADQRAARTALINRSRDITRTLEAVIQSQRRFGGLLFQDRIESALKELVKSGELTSVALLNARAKSSPQRLPHRWSKPKGTMRTGEHWDARSVTLVNLVDLGASVSSEGETNARRSFSPDVTPPPDRAKASDPVLLPAKCERTR